MNQLTQTRTLLLTIAMLVSGIAVASPNATQMKQLMNNCAQCHTDAATTAPVMGNTAVWSEIMLKGEDAVLVNVVEGIGGMPPLGYCSSCSEQDFRKLIRFMAGIPDAADSSGGQP